MKYWIIGVLEEGSTCGSCARHIDSVKPAFILVDTDHIPETGESPLCNCPECIEAKYPDLASDYEG